MREADGAAQAMRVCARRVARDGGPTCAAAAAAAAARSTRVRDHHACQRVREIVRATHGLVGAASLGKQCGMLRRAAAVIKSGTGAARAGARAQGTVQHGLRRRCRASSAALDAMHVACDEGMQYWLVAADAAIPYRTSIATVPAYDADHVIAALVADFERHGAPLVLRLDRIACQRTPEVHAMLDRYQVLPLHGPPRHPYYYGQLERQNREHRAWQRVLGEVHSAALCDAGEAMRTALNALWARPTLDWCTAEEVWLQRPTVDIDLRGAAHGGRTPHGRTHSVGARAARGQAHCYGDCTDQSRATWTVKPGRIALGDYESVNHSGNAARAQ